MISASNGADLIKRTRINSLEDFKRKIKDKDEGFNRFENCHLNETIKEPSSLAVAAQIGGSGIQVGITGLKPANEVAIFELPQFKKANGETSFDQQVQNAKDNYENFRVLAQIIEFVGTQAKELGQENFDVNIGAAGFDAHNPPSNMGNETKQKAKLAREGEYLLANVPLNTDDTRGVNNFFNPNILFTEQLRNSTGGFSLRSEQGSISNSFKVNGSILNDTVTLACSHIEGLKKGDSSVGIVCGTGFNMGIARGFNGVGFDNLKDANLELGHWPVAANANYISPFDVPLVKNGKLLSQDERNELIKTKSPEILFSGSSPDHTRSLKNILINIRDFIALPIEQIQQNRDLINILSKYLGVCCADSLVIDAAKRALEPLENIEELNDRDIAGKGLNADLPLVKNLYLDYFKRLGILIGQTLKAQGVENTKAINFTGSYFVEPMKALLEAKMYFYEGLANGLGNKLVASVYHDDRDSKGIKINLTSREEMDGMVTMIKTKANTESKRRIEALAARHRAATGA